MAIRPDATTLQFLKDKGLLDSAKSVQLDKLIGSDTKSVKPARGRTQHTPGAMNKLEQAYARHLDDRKLAGEILAWWFEPVVLRLAPRTTLRVDFMVQVADGLVEFHEVKGHWEDDARAKVKIAAALYPLFRFLAVQRVKKVWQFEEFRI